MEVTERRQGSQAHVNGYKDADKHSKKQCNKNRLQGHLVVDVYGLFWENNNIVVSL